MLTACMFIFGCASTKQLKVECARLNVELTKNQTRVGELEILNSVQKKKTQELTDQNQKLELARTSLNNEKKVRTEQALEIRRLARHFIRAQTTMLRTFSENPALLDLVGGEAIDRTKFEVGKGTLVLDLAHPLPSDGMLFSGQIFLRQSTPFFFCLIRIQGKKHHVVWMSKRLVPTESGLAIFSFDTAVAAKKGDLLAVYCPDGVGIPFDEVGGKSVLINGAIGLGQALDVTALAKPGTRNYSFGVLGFLE